MLDAGFGDYVEEWWHYAYKRDPKLEEYYDFPIDGE